MTDEPRCNFITRFTKPHEECGRLATHVLPPRMRLRLCAAHALENFGSPPPVPIDGLTAVERAELER